AYVARGDYPRAIEMFEGIVASLDGDRRYQRFGVHGVGSFVPSVYASLWLAVCFAQLGEFARGIALGQEGMRVAEVVDDPWNLAAAQWGLGHVYLSQGDLPAAIAVLERGWEICQTSQIPGVAANVAAHLGYAYALAGRILNGLPLVEHAAEQAASALRLAY